MLQVRVGAVPDRLCDLHHFFVAFAVLHDHAALIQREQQCYQCTGETNQKIGFQKYTLLT